MSDSADSGSSRDENWRHIVAQPLDVSAVLQALGAASNDPGLIATLQRAAQAIFDAELGTGSSRNGARSGSLRKQLNDVAQAIERVQRLMRNVRRLIPASDLQCAFDILERENARALRLLALHKRRLRRSAGRAGAAAAHGRFGGRLLCALIIIKAYRRVYGHAPDAKTTNAQRACAALWEAAGQQSLATVAASDMSGGVAWQRHLREGRKLDCWNLSGRDLADEELVKLTAKQALILETAARVWAGTESD